MRSAEAGHSGDREEKFPYWLSKVKPTIVQLVRNKKNQSPSMEQSPAELRNNSNEHSFSLTTIITSIVTAFGRVAESSPYLLLPQYPKDERKEGLRLHQHKTTARISAENSQDNGSRES
jgi:beta-lactamase regulating signal transducer with metallopeptidase domain